MIYPCVWVGLERGMVGWGGGEQRDITRFLYKQCFFFQLSLGVAYEKSIFSLKFSLSIAYFLTVYCMISTILVIFNRNRFENPMFSLSQGCCLSFAKNIANFSLVLLIKSLLIKKACNTFGVGLCIRKNNATSAWCSKYSFGTSFQIL